MENRFYWCRIVESSLSPVYDALPHSHVRCNSVWVTLASWKKSLAEQRRLTEINLRNGNDNRSAFQCTDDYYLSTKASSMTGICHAMRRTKSFRVKTFYTCSFWRMIILIVLTIFCRPRCLMAKSKILAASGRGRREITFDYWTSICVGCPLIFFI